MVGGPVTRIGMEVRGMGMKWMLGSGGRESGKALT